MKKYNDEAVVEEICASKAMPNCTCFIPETCAKFLSETSRVESKRHNCKILGPKSYSELGHGNPRFLKPAPISLFASPKPRSHSKSQSTNTLTRKVLPLNSYKIIRPSALNPGLASTYVAKLLNPTGFMIPHI